MGYSLMGCMRQMFWSMMLIVIVICMFGLGLLQAVTLYLQSDEVPEHIRMDLDTHWGSLLGSIDTLYVSSTGGISWVEVVKPLREVGPHVYLLFVAYICFFLFVMTNMITSLFLESGMRIAAKDSAAMAQDEIDRLGDYI